MDSYDEWLYQREKWQLSCIKELQNQDYKNIVIDFDNSGNSTIEICDDGRIHFKGNLYLSDPLVIPWNESEYYML